MESILLVLAIITFVGLVAAWMVLPDAPAAAKTSTESVPAMPSVRAEERRIGVAGGRQIAHHAVAARLFEQQRLVARRDMAIRQAR